MALILGSATEFPASDVDADELEDCNTVPGNKTSRKLVWWLTERAWPTFLADASGYVANLF